MKRFKFIKENDEIKAEGVEFTSHLYVIRWLPDNIIDVVESIHKFKQFYTIQWIDREQSERQKHAEKIKGNFTSYRPDMIIIDDIGEGYK